MSISGWVISRSTQNWLKITSFNLRVQLCRIRLSPRWISKAKLTPLRTTLKVNNFRPVFRSCEGFGEETCFRIAFKTYSKSYLWHHINQKLHQLGYLYVTWPKSRDVIRVRYHVMKVITPEKPGTELASFLEKKSRRVWERLGASFLEKISKNGFFG